jgi:hypothetical protein
MGRFGPPVGKYAVPLERRFWNKVLKTDDCWLWTGALNAPEGTRSGGYGVVGTTRPKTALAHRVAWELVNGPIPAGMVVAHRCDNRRCVNPAHLFIGTQKDNVHDMLAKGRQRNQFKHRTHCCRGHEYTCDNTRLYAGRRWCRRCARDRAAKRKAARTP